MGARLERIDVGGRTGWLKRVEAPSIRMRLQKGNCKRAFEQERAALCRLRAMGMPVPRILEQGDDYFVTEDAGPTLRAIRRDMPDDFPAATADAARALAWLHTGNVSHGRPALRDICWKDGKVTFIDLERVGRARPGLAGHANDCLTFFYDFITETGEITPEVEAAREAYIEAGMHEVWNAARAKVRRLQPLVKALRPVLHVLREKRDFRAAVPFVTFMMEDLPAD